MCVYICVCNARQIALVYDKPGVTRDSIEGICVLLAPSVVRASPFHCLPLSS